MKKFLKIFVISLVMIILTVVIIGSGVVGNMVADNLVYQNKEEDTKENSKKQLEEWGYDYLAFEEKYDTQSFFIVNKEGYKIPTYILGAKALEEKPTVLLIHGLGGDYVSVYPQAEMYLSMGYNVVAMDQRASGQSLDQKLSFGHYEKSDVQEVVTYIRDNLPTEKLMIHGLSMGAVTSGLYAETAHANENVDAIILDSAFDSFENVFLAVWDSMDTGIPKEYAVFCGNIGLALKYGFNFNDVDMVQAIGKSQIPIMIIQGVKDELATIEMGNRIFESVKSDGKLMWQVDAEHVKGYIEQPIEYKKRVLEFIHETEAVSKGNN